MAELFTCNQPRELFPSLPQGREAEGAAAAHRFTPCKMLLRLSIRLPLPPSITTAYTARCNEMFLSPSNSTSRTSSSTTTVGNRSISSAKFPALTAGSLTRL